MAVYFVQGKLGAGKSITTIGRIKEYLWQGRPVATNIDIHLPRLTGSFDNRSIVHRLPDQPRVEDFEAIGFAHHDIDESKNGLIALDECGTWLNSRNWNDKSRRPVIDWLLHARKYGWDVIFIIQDVSAIDNQARELLMEYCVTCKRLDRMGVPIIGPLVNVMSFGEMKIQLPRIHVANVQYTETKQTTDRWICRGSDIYGAYDTKQIFSPHYIADPEQSGVAGVYTLLRPWFFEGRHMVPRNKEFYMRLSRIYFRKLQNALYALAFVVSISAALAVGASIGEEPQQDLAQDEPVTKKLVERSMEIISLSTYESRPLVGSGTLSLTERVRLTDGRSTFDMVTLLSQGYQQTVISECYRILHNDYERITLTCAPSPILSDSTPSGTNPI